MSFPLPSVQKFEPPRKPSKADIDCTIAQSLEDAKKYEEALTTANMILDDDPDHPWALLIAGRVALRMQRNGLAYSLLKRALELSPNRWDVKRNFAAACIGVLRLDEARRILQQIRRERPQDEKALGLLCLLAVYDCNPRLAIELGEKSLAILPGQKDVHESLGYAHLMVGEFEPGWDGYEKFIGASKHRPIKPPYAECPYWDGAEGINLYIRGEQGIGDEISFVSVIPDIAPKLTSLTFDCDEKLGGLFKRSFPNAEVHPTRKSRSADKAWLQGRGFDAWALVGSLAHHRRKNATDFPGTPYLVADPERRVQWRALLDTLPGKKVGIAWSGGLRSTFRDRRSLTLEDLLPVLRVPGISWVSLQYQDPTLDIAEFEAERGIKITHWPRAAESQDYDDQASLVAELDLVITVCTAVVHLSGGLGTKCWVLVPSKPRWFYQLNGERLPWYGSVELFRQTDQWPLHQVARRLAEFAA